MRKTHRGTNPIDVEKDYYSILGVAETASQDEIERIYKRLAMLHHPDRGGDQEEMKAINEAYRVLGNVDTRRTYDSRFHRSDDVFRAVTPPLTPPSALLPDTVPGRLLGALFVLLAGLVLLFLVRIYYIRFMWPILLVAVFVVILGVWKVHKVMVFARKSLAPSYPMRRFVWAQELAFWSIASLGAYGICLLMSGM
jgi:DnaJ domain